MPCRLTLQSRIWSTSFSMPPCPFDTSMCAELAKPASSAGLRFMLAQMKTGSCRYSGRWRSACNTSKPFRPGIIRSSTIASGRCSSRPASAARPSAMHSAVMPMDCSVAAIRSRAEASSSTTITRSVAELRKPARRNAPTTSSGRIGLVSTSLMRKPASDDVSVTIVTTTTDTSPWSACSRSVASTSSPLRSGSSRSSVMAS